MISPAVAWLIFVGSIMFALYALGAGIVKLFDSPFSNDEDDELSERRRKKEEDKK